MQHELVQIKLRCVTAVAAAARERASNSPLAEAKACIDLILGIAYSSINLNINCLSGA